MSSSILDDSKVLRTILEYVLLSSGGRRSLSRIACTCKALSDPALDVLWRELDSFLPLVSLFPAHLLRNVRRPNLGLIDIPLVEDWNRFLLYGARVQRITYEQSVGLVPPSIFPVIDKYRPRPFILPNLISLTWRVETMDGLSRCMLFVNPELQSLTLEITTGSSQLSSALGDISGRARLSTLSFTSRTTSQDALMELLRPQHALETLTLNAPAALSPSIGRWISFHPTLRTLNLDLSGGTPETVEDFFLHIREAAGLTSTSSSVHESDDMALRSLDILSNHAYTSRGPCAGLEHLHLAGEASTIAFFVGHLSSQVHLLRLAVEYPAGEPGWRYLFQAMGDHFNGSLRYLRVTATSASLSADRQRTAARGGLPVLRHFSLEHFAALTQCTHLDIHLPESAYLRDADMHHLAEACPNLEEARLCPHARFPVALGAPKLTMEGLAVLTANCPRLRALSVVVNALAGSEDVLSTRDVSSQSLLLLSVGQSWVNDALQTAILLSHLAPNLDVLNWDVSSKNRHAQSWQKVLGYLPHLQTLRRFERRSKPEAVSQPRVQQSTAEKSIDATELLSTATAEIGVQVRPPTAEGSVQAAPSVVDCEADAALVTFTTHVEAVSRIAHREVDAVHSVADKSVQVGGETSMDAVVSTEHQHVDVQARTRIEMEIDDEGQDRLQGNSPSATRIIFYSVDLLRSIALFIVPATFDRISRFWPFSQLFAMFHAVSAKVTGFGISDKQ